MKLNELLENIFTSTLVSIGFGIFLYILLSISALALFLDINETIEFMKFMGVWIRLIMILTFIIWVTVPFVYEDDTKKIKKENTN